MQIEDIVDTGDLECGIADGLIKVREYPDGYRIYNYTDAAMYTPGAWDNEAVRKCRGIITDGDGEVVALPWEKFFNYGQEGAAEIGLDEIVQVSDKEDGSLGILYPASDGTIRVATRGSLTSEQAEWATAWLKDNDYCGLSREDVLENTFLVEIVYPENQIVIDYHGYSGLIMLGIVDIYHETYCGPGVAYDFGWTGLIAEGGYATLREVLAFEDRHNAEGWVVRAGKRMLKIKQADYIEKHRIVTGLSERRVWEIMMRGDSLEDAIGSAPDEVYEWASSVWNNLEECVRREFSITFDILREIALTDAATMSDRARFADQAKRHGDRAKYLFMLYDGKEIYDAILRSMKPAGNLNYRTITEEVA